MHICVTFEMPLVSLKVKIQLNNSKKRQSLKVVNVPAIYSCDLNLGHTKLKCKLAQDIVIINICVKFDKKKVPK